MHNVIYLVAKLADIASAKLKHLLRVACLQLVRHFIHLTVELTSNFVSLLFVDYLTP